MIAIKEAIQKVKNPLESPKCSGSNSHNIGRVIYVEVAREKEAKRER